MCRYRLNTETFPVISFIYRDKIHVLKYIMRGIKGFNTSNVFSRLILIENGDVR